MLRLIGKHLKAIGIGALLLGLLMTLIVGMDLGRGSGSRIGLLDLLLLWALCTGAAILGPMILASWLVGLLVVSFLERMKTNKPGPDRIPLLMDYIQNAKREGVPRSRMDTIMSSNGWGPDEIAEARRRIAESPAG